MNFLQQAAIPAGLDCCGRGSPSNHISKYEENETFPSCITVVSMICKLLLCKTSNASNTSITEEKQEK
jgi:hypothetical protein